MKDIFFNLNKNIVTENKKKTYFHYNLHLTDVSCAFMSKRYASVQTYTIENELSINNNFLCFILDSIEQASAFFIVPGLSFGKCFFLITFLSFIYIFFIFQQRNKSKSNNRQNFLHQDQNIFSNKYFSFFTKKKFEFVDCGIKIPQYHDPSYMF